MPEMNIDWLPLVWAPAGFWYVTQLGTEPATQAWALTGKSKLHPFGLWDDSPTGPAGQG